MKGDSRKPAPPPAEGETSDGPCSECSRAGKLVFRETFPPLKHLGIHEPFEIRLWLCRWHKAAWTRRGRTIFFDKPERKSEVPHAD